MNAGAFIQRIVKEAGKAALKLLGKEGTTYSKSKGRWDVVTKADLSVEKKLIAAIRKRYPSHGIIAEESGRSDEGAEYVWIVDPIDGTLNFSLGIPMFGVMVCLAKKGTVLLSAISIPATKELFFAKKGKGAFLNGKRIHCSLRKTLDHSLGCTSASLRGKVAPFLKNLSKAAETNEIMIGSLGSMAVNACYTACGKRDWIVALVGGIPHDFAPTYLMLKEAGCTVTTAKGTPWTLADQGFVAANPVLHKQLLKLTKGI